MGNEIREVKGYIKTPSLEVQNFKIADKKERIIEGFFTTTDLDRGGDISLTSAFEKTITEYMKNPILTYMHSLDKVMGKVLEYNVVADRGVWIKAQVAKDVKWIDEEVWPLIDQGIIKGFSYGYTTKDEEKGLKEGKEVNYLKEVELFEIAIVTLPMNANALFNISSTGAVKSMTIIEEKTITTPESKQNKKEEELSVEKIEELLQSVKTLSDAVTGISEKFGSLDVKAKELVSSIAEATAVKIKEMREAEIKEKEEKEAKESLEKEDTEILQLIKEVNEAMGDIVKVLVVEKEEK